MKASESAKLLKTLKLRFESNMPRHEDLQWVEIEKRLTADADKLWSLGEMERTDGEPDVIAYDAKSREYLFVDCAPESPQGRRSLCYDREALDARKANKPKGGAIELAAAMKIDLLSEAQYRQLQGVGEFDLKTSSWVKTPAAIRKLDGALFCDRRYDAVFVYHNGAQSYYAARGFRGALKV